MGGSRALVVSVCAAALTPLVYARGAETSSALIARGFDHFYNLEYPEAMAAFEQAVRLNPDAPYLHNYLASAIVFQEMLRGGALESELVSGSNPFLRRPKLNPSPDTERRFLDVLGKAMALAQARLDRDPKDPVALYAMGISHGLRANWNFLVRKAWRDALRDTTAGRKLHNRLSELQPDNVDARLMQGLHDYVVGSLPFAYRVLGFLVGFRGDREKGIRTVREVAAKGRLNRVDAEIFLCALYRRENQPGLALPLLEDLLTRFPRNYLLRFEQSQMYSRAGDGKRALECLEQIGELKRAGAPGYDNVRWETILYHRGTVEFWYRDYARAEQDMLRVTQAGGEIDLNMGGMAWLRLGQIYDLTGRRPAALDAYRKTIAHAPQADAAREARRYLSARYRRDKI
jgi:tetratricopeptide (TPR) repeat protein